MSLALVAVVCGCTDEPSAPSRPERNAVDASRVICRVNGVSLTRGQLDAYVDMMMEMQKICKVKMGEQELAQLRAELWRTFPETFIQNTLMADYCRREKIELSEKRLKSFQQRAAMSLGGRVRSYDDLKKRLGPHADLFDGLVRAEALQDAVKKHLAELTPTNLTPVEIGNALRNIDIHNETMSKTNELIFARAERVWKELKAGADFNELARKYTEIDTERDDNCEWGTIDLQQFAAETNVCAWAVKLKVGEFSPPIEGDNGLMILRLDAKNAEKGEYTFSRIFFQLPLFAEKLTAEEIVAEVRRRHREELFLRKANELYTAAKVEYFKENEQNDSKKEGVR